MRRDSSPSEASAQWYIPIVYHASQIDFSREELREPEEGSREASARDQRAINAYACACVNLCWHCSSVYLLSTCTALYIRIARRTRTPLLQTTGETDGSRMSEVAGESHQSARIRSLADLLAARVAPREAALRKGLFLRRSWTGYALGACTRRFYRFYRAALAAGRLRSWNTYSRTPGIARGSHPRRGPPRGSALSRRRDRCHEWLRFQLPRLRRPPIVLNTFTASFDPKGLYRFGYLALLGDRQWRLLALWQRS
jgi:hypothetical protein